MRLKTKLVLAATALTFALVLLMSTIFVGELLRQRIEQTVSSNEVLAHEMVLVTRQAVETGLRDKPPANLSEGELRAAVAEALRNNDELADLMSAIVRYSPTVQDVSVADANGRTLVSTDPDAFDQTVPSRTDLHGVRDGSVFSQTKQVFGTPHVLNLSAPLERNGKPFLLVHVGVRSTFLRAMYEPWLRAAFVFALLAALASMLAAAVLANAALWPIEHISRQLDKLTRAEGVRVEDARLEAEEERRGPPPDAVLRATRSISRLGEQMRSTEAGYTALQTNLNQMLDTLRDGVLLLAADARVVMASDSVAKFLNREQTEIVGRRLEEVFDLGTALGSMVVRAVARGEGVSAETVVLEDGRRVQVSLDRIEDGQESGRAMGTMVTLRDTESAMQLEQELEVSRRLAAIGRLTAGVGHEVKNPINAMVVHLELLKGKLAGPGDGGAAPLNGATAGAQRHVEILAGEMQRLDRVVQTLADFTRPMELNLAECNLREVVASVVELTGVEMHENGVQVMIEAPREPLMVRVDAELMRQALLNLMLNGMQAMPGGGLMRVAMRRDGYFAVVEVTDQGEGIAPDVLPRIFDLYFTTKAKGSGIGLATTYRILQMHGGALDVRSNPDASAEDHGTTFTVKLPIAMMASFEARKSASLGAARLETSTGDLG